MPGSQPEAEGTYLFPRHPSEIDRLDLQHYALRELLGTNYLAPVERPGWILDSGCGTGQWGFDLGVQFPNALVVGLDLQPGKRGGPANCRFVRADLLGGLPFPEGCFDFVHQRFLFTALPVARWPDTLRDLVRVTRRGGWVELVEAGFWLEPAGPATRRLCDLAGHLAATRGLDSTSAVSGDLDRRLADAGLEAVKRRSVAVPVGEWGGQVGSFMASDARAAARRLSPGFQVTFGISPSECQELIATMYEEFDRYRSRWEVVFAWGRRP